MSRRLLLPVSLALFATLTACSGSSDSTLSEAQIVSDPLLKAMSTPEWVSEIYRASDDGLLKSLGLSAPNNGGIIPPADFLVVTQTKPDQTKVIHTYKIGCSTVDSMQSIEMRAAFGQVGNPPKLEEKAEAERDLIIETYRENQRTLDCATGSTESPESSASIESATLTSITNGSADQTRVYLRQVSFSDVLVVDPTCEARVLKSLGLGSRENQTPDSLWINSTLPLSRLQKEDRVALKCVKERKIATFKELCDNYQTVAGGYEDLYFSLRKQFASGPAGADCSFFANSVKSGLKSSKTLNLSGVSNLNLKLVLGLNVLKEKPVGDTSDEIWLDDIEVIDLQNQKVTMADLVQLSTVLNARSKPITLKLRGLRDENGRAISDFSFFGPIVNNSNIVVDFSEEDVQVGATNCPVVGTNAQITSLCLKTTPFFDVCKRALEGSVASDAETALKYLDQYRSESENEIKDKDVPAKCKILTQALVSRKTITMENAGISNLTPFRNLPNLEALIVPGNKLNSMAVSGLTAVPKLAELNLARNLVEQLPAQAEFRKTLVSLDVSDNKLESLAGISDYSALSVLVAARNPLTALTGLDALAKTMSYLDVKNTTVFGTQAVSNFTIVGKLSDLQFLDISSTSMNIDSGTLVESNKLGGKFANLLYFNVSDNQLTGDAVHLKKVNAGPVPAPLTALVGFGTKLENLQSFEEKIETLTLPYFSANAPGDIATVTGKLASSKAFYQYMYGEAKEDPFAGITMLGSVTFVAPELLFDKSNVNCSLLETASNPPRAAKALCGK